MNSKKALVIVDVQNDFCPGGALAVPDGDKIITNINKISKSDQFHKVVATQDWHPENHVSFASNHDKDPYETIKINDINQTLWPAHCVPGTKGAEFHPDLDIKPVDLIIRKGSNPSIDSYSAFLENDKKTETGLHYYLKGMEIDEISVCGLATNYCVYYTCLDGLKFGFKVNLLQNATKGIDQPEGSVKKALDNMKQNGVNILQK
ncbi:MAG: bifunctional nicotinamidase/pyrazinamidase [Elusimicrobiota bacterium]